METDGNPLTGASMKRGMKKIAIFDQYLALSRKRYEIQSVTTEGE